ncbi:MAG: diaminopimelate epimerase [Gammaproteobacteria bacterium SG8_11]|nr:MAG: diaminopimelate epimerase [Gammaproteobacteria bacterium SG8_11]
MELEFTKMHGLGNDFVVINAIDQTVALTGEQIRFIADRHFGVGCDQLLLVEPADRPEVDFRYRIFNSDGGEVEQCGNGARCFARFVRDKRLTDKNPITVSTNTGVIELTEQADGQVTVNMGVPKFNPPDIPLVAEQLSERYVLDLPSQQVEFGAVSMGNPHAVLLVDDVQQAPVQNWGPLLQKHERFPQRVNVGFMQIVDTLNIRLRVYERGVGETLACGTGACAAVVVGRKWGLLQERVNVNLPGGQLMVQWAGEGEPVWMTGPAESVFEGRISI